MSRAARRTATRRTTPTISQATRPWTRTRAWRRPAPGSSSGASARMAGTALGGGDRPALVIAPDLGTATHRCAAPQRGARADQEIHRLDRGIAHVCHRLETSAHPQGGHGVAAFDPPLEGADEP